MNLKQNNKSIFGVVLALFFFSVLILFVSCSQEELNQDNTKLNQNGHDDYLYEYEECMNLKDGDLYVKYCIQSDSREEINYIISLRPIIKVEPHTLSTSNTGDLDQLATQDIEYRKPIVSESIVGGNIPPGYRVAFSYENITNGNNLLESRSYSTHEFTDSGAIGIYVSEGGYQLTCTFYSKGGCCVTWHNRGYRTIGPSHTHSHLFETEDYTTKIGAKMTAYTTTAAWNATTKWFLY